MTEESRETLLGYALKQNALPVDPGSTSRMDQIGQAVRAQWIAMGKNVEDPAVQREGAFMGFLVYETLRAWGVSPLDARDAQRVVWRLFVDPGGPGALVADRSIPRAVALAWPRLVQGPA